MDLKIIGTALATTIGTITVGTESATATARLPNNVGSLGLLVFPPAIDLAFLMGPYLDAHLIYPVRLLRDPLSMPERADALLDWMTALWPKPQSNYDLGVAGVIEAQATHIDGQPNGYVYPGATGVDAKFDVVEMMVDVHVYELAVFG